MASQSWALTKFFLLAVKFLKNGSEIMENFIPQKSQNTIKFDY